MSLKDKNVVWAQHLAGLTTTTFALIDSFSVPQSS
jgi:hypothetical protein